MTATFFDRLHPAVALACLAAVLVATFVCLNPVLIAMSLVCSLAFNGMLSGPRAVGRALLWQLPLLVIITLINPFFSAQGSTLLGTPIPGHPIFFESVCYGLMMGALLVAVLQWFSCVSRVLGSDKVMNLASGRFPTLTLMLSMTLRLVPQLVERGRLISDTAAACTVAPVPAAPARLRQLSVLMGWSMEESLETADAMKVRGWASGKRTSYRRVKVRRRDLCWIAAVLALFAATLASYLIGGVCSLYPTLDIPHPAYLMLSYLALVALPPAAELIDRISWRTS